MVPPLPLRVPQQGGGWSTLQRRRRGAQWKEEEGETGEGRVEEKKKRRRTGEYLLQERTGSLSPWRTGQTLPNLEYRLQWDIHGEVRVYLNPE